MKEKIWIKAMELGSKTGCHQMAERSFFLFSWQFPVCARCTGVFIGQAAACILGCFKKILSPIIAVFMILIMGLDWFIQHQEIRPSTNLRRLITGFLGGLGITSLYIRLIRKIIKVFHIKFKKG